MNDSKNSTGVIVQIVSTPVPSAAPLPPPPLDRRDKLNTFFGRATLILFDRPRQQRQRGRGGTTGGMYPPCLGRTWTRRRIEKLAFWQQRLPSIPFFLALLVTRIQTPDGLLIKTRLQLAR